MREEEMGKRPRRIALRRVTPALGGFLAERRRDEEMKR
jgi:hypothetical protein